MNYQAGNKVFATEEEARGYSKDAMAYGAIAPMQETDKEVTHRYLGNYTTEEVEHG